MKKIIHFIGIDVSKKTFDVAIIQNNDNRKITSLVFANDSNGFKEFKTWLAKQKLSFQETVFCIEHTGYYSKPLAKFIIANQGNLWMEMSLKIIRSLGRILQVYNILRSSKFCIVITIQSPTYLHFRLC